MGFNLITIRNFEKVILHCIIYYNSAVSNADSATRLMALSDLYRIDILSPMSTEIYSKLYLSLLQSLQKKGTKLAVQQRNENSKIIPCLIVQCPFNSSVKGLLLEILRKADEARGTTYYHHAVRSRASTADVLIGTVSRIALNHIGLLVVDEIQNVANSKNGKSLVGMLNP